jgi:hypothetical protein
MTAVEWLQMKMATSSAEEMVGNINTWFKQAKKMEKEQKIKFAENCLDKALDLDIRTAFSNVEKYYNETFKQQEQ